MSDPLDFPLTIPPGQIPYLEKHRIYELFHELARELVIQQPADHVMFLKQILTNAANLRDTARIIILHSPRVNCLEIAIEISKITDQVVISEYSLLRCLEKNSREEISPKLMAQGLYYLIRAENAYKHGWIIVGCIHTEDEVRAVLNLGILPTLVIHLIAPFHPSINELLYCNVRGDWPEYRRRIFHIRHLFSNVLKEVHLKQKTVEEVVAECVNISKIRKGPHFIKPRIIILGPRGSGRKTQARILATKLNIVHVDFEYLICQAWMAETDLGIKLRECKSEVCFHSDLLAQVLNKRILEDDCLEQGWVLTGFPYTVNDLKYLDGLDTPPSRIIFLDIDINICMERIRHRRHNIYTGSVTNIKDSPEAMEEKQLKLHPKNDEKLISAELYHYCENYGALKKYCGETAAVVNGDQDPRCVSECITSAVVKSLPPGATRTGLVDLQTPSSTGSCGCIPIPDHVSNCYIRKM